MPFPTEAPHPPTPRRWRIGPVRFDAATGRVDREGRVTELDRRSAALLGCLAEAGGQPVDKEVLLAVGWPGRTVTENSLAKAVGRLRRDLGEEAGLLLRVEHGFGYRLLEAVPWAEVPGAPGIPRPARRPRVAVLAGLLLILAGGAAWGWRATRIAASTDLAAAPSIAVLPFEDLSPGHDQRFFAEGLSDQLIGTLGALQGLKVAGRSASYPFRDRRADAVAIGRELRVSTVLDGSVQRQGDRLRVSVELVDARTGFKLWSEHFDRAFTDLFAIQDEIARAILAHLRVELLPGEPRPGRGLHTTRADAFERYLYALHVFKDDETGGRRSLMAFEEAVRLDPEFYEGRVALADALGFTGFYADRAEEALEGKRRALAEVTRAIESHPELPDAWWLRADLKYSHWWDWKGAAQDLAEGAKVGGTAHIRYQLRFIRLKAAQGELEEAIRLGRRAWELDQRDGTPLLVAGYHLTALGRYAEAEPLLQQALSLDPTEEHIHYYLGLIDLLQGRAGESVKHFEDSAHVFRLTGLALAHHQLGDRAGSDAQLALLRTRYAHIQPYQVASVHAFRGETEAAFHWLDRATELRDASLIYVKWDPLLKNLHGDARWKRLLAKVGLG
ncbi:MAG TPA: winged helix-turn-helix domain-containing protein [Holophagaceae bacterium]|nr:winged helix-turn-helix domain-containing protein [Holophagaceae bacterium]